MSEARTTEGGYHNLDVYQAAHKLGNRIHEMTLKLPKFEMYEEGSQIRRSSKRVSASIVEGYSQRRHKALFLNYLYRALGSADETQEHLRYLMETGSLADKKEGQSLLSSAGDLSRKLVQFIKGIERDHEGRPLLTVSSELQEEFADLDLTSEISTSDIRDPKSKD